MTTNFVAKGTEIIKQAVQKDNAEEYEAALSLYSQGIQYLMTGLKYEKNQKVVGAIKEKVQKYLKRAEDIKTSIEEPPKKTKKKVLLLSLTYPCTECMHPQGGQLYFYKNKNVNIFIYIQRVIGTADIWVCPRRIQR